ncbi:MAG: Hpt domain-containing protein, partial [Chloroflexota bacterium]
MFTLDDDIMRQLRATFKVEAAEHIQAMNRILLALEQNPEGEERAELLEEIFREAHSLKGAAGAADLGEVEATAHRLENTFGAARSGKIKLTREICDVLYAGIDAVSTVVDAALEERPHGLDLPGLYASLDALEQGHVVPLAKPAQTTASPAPQETKPPSVQPVELVAPNIAPSAQPEANLAIRAIDQDAKAKAYKGEERRKSTSLGPAGEETIRVATGKIDTLMTQA